MAVRTIGSDYGYGQVRQNNSGAAQETAKGYSTLQQGNQQFAQISSDITNSQIQSNEAVANSVTAIANTRIQQAQQPSDLQVLAGVTQNIIGAQKKFEEGKQKQELEAQKKWMTENMALFSQGADGISSQAEDTVFNTDKGQKGYQTQVEGFLKQAYGKITPEDYAKLSDKLYSAGHSAEKIREGRMYNAAKELRDTQQETASMKFKAMVSNQTPLIEHYAMMGDTKGVQNSLDTITGVFNQVLNESGMTDAIQLLNFQKDFWDSFGKNTQMAYETQLQVQRYSTGIQAIHDASVQWYQEHGNNDPNGLSALWATVGKQYGIDLSTAKDVGDPMKRAKQDFDILQMQDQTRSLQQKDLISRTEALQINDKGAIYLAAQLFQDPAGVDGIKNSQWLSSSPTHKRAVALVEEVKDFQKKNATADSQAIDITKQIADLDANYNKFAAGQIPSGSGGQSQMKTALSVMGASGNYSADQMQAMQGILQGGQKSDPAAEQQRQEFLTNYAQSVQEQRNALLLKKQQLYDGLTQQRAQLEAAGIIDPKTGKPFTNVDKYKKDYEDVQRQMNTTATQSQEAYGQGAGGATPNFNSSVQPAKLNSGRGVNGAVPFAASDLSKISSGGGFGEDRGDHKHGGWDIKAPLGTSLISLVNGKVTYSGCDRDPGGFGCYIDIKDDATGNTMRYGHMQKGIYFKTGDRVGIGQNVGKVGVTGHTTGAHVHWEVIGKDGNKLNPETAFAGVNFQSRMPSQNSGKFHKPGTPNPYNQQTLNRDNTAGTTIPSNALPLPNGNYAVNNKLISNNPVINQMLNQDVKVLDQYYNHSNPIRNDLPNNSMSSTVNPSNKGNKDSHGNWLDSNYNYNSLAQRPKEERQLLHQTADRLGIPAIWLADALYIENDQFTSGNPNPYGCVGRIQFCPDSGNTKTIGGKVYSMQQIASMTASQQYELIYQYFQGSMKAGGYKLNSFADVWSTIRWNRSAAKALKTGKVNSGDGLGSTWYTDSDRVQRTVGRKYQFPGVNDRNQRANAVIHNSPVASCPTCNQLSASNSNFVHHEGLG